MYVYETGPIDFWDGCTRLQDYLRHTFGCTESEIQSLIFEERFPQDKVASYSSFDFQNFYSKALEIAKRYGPFEGDFREGPYVTALPNPDHGCCHMVIMWKQDNNGVTFIASQVELTWLKDNLIYGP